MQKMTASFGYISSGEYSLDVHRNLRSGTIYGATVTAAATVHFLNRFSEAAQALDSIKKTLFYGKGAAERLSALAGTALPRIGDRLSEDGMSVDLFHGILGLVTETGEIAEAVTQALGTGRLDRANLREEIGDCLWYLAVAAKALGTSLEECAKVNTDKLRVRYPQNFTEDAAINRDLAAERTVLEQPDPRDEVFTSGSDLDA